MKTSHNTVVKERISDQLLAIKGVRDYYDDGDISKEQFDILKERIDDNEIIVEKLIELISEYEKQVWESPTNHRMVVKHLKQILLSKADTGGKQN